MYFYAARQPILDAEKNLFAYELLFRDGVDNVFPGIDEDEATTRIIEGSQFNLGLAHLTGNKPAFINFTLDTILKNYPAMLPPETLVVEILETVTPGKKLLASVIELKKQGYVIALDDYEHKPVWRHFFPYVDIIKIDLRAMSFEEVEQVMTELAEFKHINYLAEKVETLAEFNQCKKMGFKYFQGYFFSKPEMVKTKTLSPSQLTLSELLAETSSTDIDLPKVTQIFERDINLSYKLLRYSNSATFKRRADISTIKQAIVALGKYELKKFLSLLFTASVSDEKPQELLRLAMVRARFCENLAEINEDGDASMAFLTGMLSLIDAILDEDIATVMEQLPLSLEIKEALVNKKGKLATYLQLAMTYERGLWEQESALETSLKLSDEQVPAIYANAIDWSNEQISSINS
ncbi:MAG: EAL and modified HD-GYP domain-containing signal transduction protein [Psychrosphaera sp.]|jgi:EAL and modified HD-GYP domain-containing signal transduction protein|uniref:HDOD domain-containing protein n=1 Tax=Psychrosphaera aquimarina TaxID=2044854 RepID=A0ABU3R2K9_9GAMM|nr:HDOD domain-containing protein [Psychrosphaera aquimarina]MDU0113905.1 HDOD domain-containing protein [Psychrosphaera aquimarina]